MNKRSKKRPATPAGPLGKGKPGNKVNLGVATPKVPVVQMPASNGGRK